MRATVPKLATSRGLRVQPIVIGCYTLTATGLNIQGHPTYDEHQGVGDFIQRAHHASGFWLADWLRYGESRRDWQERLDQAVDSTGLTEKTLRNVRAVGAIPASRRRDDVEFGLHAEVAGMSDKAQAYWLRKAAEGQWDRRELRLQIRSARRARVIEGQALLAGMYRVIYADPPWIYGDRMPSGSSAEAHYPGLTIEELCKLPVQAHALRDSVLFLWTTAPLILANPGPREVGEAWGFTYKQQICWDKVDHNFGHYTGGNHEVLTIWTRGHCLPDEPTDLPDSVQVIRKSREHSAKPEEFRRLIVKHWTQGPRLELFGRAPSEGWTVFGNDARLWHREAEVAV